MFSMFAALIFIILCLVSCANVNVTINDSPNVYVEDDRERKELSELTAGEIIFMIVTVISTVVIAVGVPVFVIIFVVKNIRRTAVEAKKAYAEVKYAHEAAKEPIKKADKCPNCGASVEITEGKAAKCSYCNSFVS